jgi:hypothetical protein
MEFEHVTFDLPHGTFHALQGGDPGGQPNVAFILSAAPRCGELGSWQLVAVL